MQKNLQDRKCRDKTCCTSEYTLLRKFYASVGFTVIVGLLIIGTATSVNWFKLAKQRHTCATAWEAEMRGELIFFPYYCADIGYAGYAVGE